MATTFKVAKNSATTTLNGGIDDTVGSLTVVAGAVFPTTFPFPISIDDEIMLCTNRVGNVLTVTRAQEGTAAAAHLTASTVALNITAIYITDISTAVNAIENAKGAASGLASLNASTKVVEQPAAITDHLELTPTEDLATKAPTSEWAFDHVAAADPHTGYLLESILTTRGDLMVRGAAVAARLAKGSIYQRFRMATADDQGWVDEIVGIEFVIDGGGVAITTGVKGFIEVPFACTITGVTLLADQSGSIVIDVWKDTYGNYPPTVADTITAAAKPTITTATKSQDTTLTGWTVAVTAGNVIGFNVDSCTTITRCTISLRAKKT